MVASLNASSTNGTWTNVTLAGGALHLVWSPKPPRPTRNPPWRLNRVAGRWERDAPPGLGRGPKVPNCAPTGKR